MPLPCPVIVVPGITASILRDEYPVQPERVWNLTDAVASPLATAAGHFDRIALHPDDLRFELKEPARVVADALFGMPYAELVNELRHNLTLRGDEPVPVFPLAYDWRQPLEQVEDDLASFVDEVIGRTRLLRHYHAAGYGTERFRGRVHLVGHSMGGLVIAGYVARHGFDRVDRIATLGSPFRGSHEAVLKVATGLAALGAAASSSREREVARLTPSLYYLLPSYEGAVKAVAGLRADLFQVGAWQPGILATLREHIRLHGLGSADPGLAAHELLGRMLEAARLHRARLEALRLEEPKRWLAIAGVGNRTRVALQIERRQGAAWFNLSGTDRQNDWAPGGHQSVNTGDGTVPYAGARSAFLPVSQMVCLCPDDLGYWEIEDRVLQAASGLHPILPKINLAHRWVISHLLGRPLGEIWGWRSPDLPADEVWDPPLPGLRARNEPVPPRRRGRPRRHG